MPSAEIYTEEVHDQLKRYATWLPTEHVEVGAVGRLDGKMFVPYTSLKKLGISFKMVKDPSSGAAYKFMSRGITEVSGAASIGGVVTPAGTAAASLKIGFSRARSVYFSLANCIGSAVEDLKDLGERILAKLAERKWQTDYMVVTRVVTAGSGTILQAESNDASIELSGTVSGTPVLDLMKAAGSVQVRSQKSVGLNIVAQGQLTPLLGLAKVQYSFLDKVLRKSPKFDYWTTLNSIGMTQFMAHIETTPTLTVHSERHKASGGEGLILDAKIPRYGDYVDMTDLVKLASKTLQTGTAQHRGKKAVTLPNLEGTTRVHRKWLQEVVDQSPHVELMDDAKKGDFYRLNVRLQKSGRSVRVTPIVELAKKAAQSNPSTMSVELSFDEIP